MKLLRCECLQRIVPRETVAANASVLLGTLLGRATLARDAIRVGRLPVNPRIRSGAVVAPFRLSPAARRWNSVLLAHYSAGGCLRSDETCCLAVNSRQPYAAVDVSASKHFLKSASNGGCSRIRRRIDGKETTQARCPRIWQRGLIVRIIVSNGLIYFNSS
jgi:hypothetical protein